jgi:glycerol uptake facilitator protein
VTFGWGFAVLAGAYASGPLSGAHLNPAVTVGLAVHSGDWSKVPLYLSAQMLGALVGAVLCYLAYLGQFRRTPKRCSGTGPSIVALLVVGLGMSLGGPTG